MEKTTSKNHRPLETAAIIAIIALIFCPAGAQAGWAFYNTSNSPLQTNYISSLGISPDGEILIGSNGRGLYVFGEPGWRHYNQSNTGVPIDFAFAVTYDHDTLFVGSASGDLDAMPLGEGLSILNLVDSTWSQFNAGLEVNQIITGVEIAPDYRAISTYGGGLTIFNDVGWIRYQTDFRTEYTYADSQQQTFKVDPGTYLTTDYLRGLDYDQQNEILWIGTLDGGAVAYHDGDWQNYNMSNSGLPSNRIQLVRVKPNDSTVYFGTYGFGLAQKSGDTWTIYNTGNSPIVSNYVYSLAFRPDNGDLWIGTDNALSVKQSDDTWKSYVPPDSNLIYGDFYSDIAFDSADHVWVSTFGGGVAFKRLHPEPEPQDTLLVDVLKLKFFLRSPARHDITWLRANLEPDVELTDNDSVSIAVDSDYGNVYSWQHLFDLFSRIFHWGNLDIYLAYSDGSTVLLEYHHNQDRIKLYLLDWRQDVNRDNIEQQLDVRIAFGDYVGHDIVTIGPVNPAYDPDADTLDYEEGDLLLSTDYEPIIVGIDDEGSGSAPTQFALPTNHPNPFNASTEISFGMPAPAKVEFIVFDILGREITSEVKLFGAGQHSIIWNGSDKASGVYYYTLNIGAETYTGKMTLLK